MPELPQKKVGIVACSGEELAEGTITRLAALKVLEQLQAGDTVTICLPLFLAGGEGDRAFARFYPTIAIDGCEKRCAYRGTELYSNRPAASVVVSELIDELRLDKPEGKRKLNEAGLLAVDAVAEKVSAQVDELLGRDWNRREGKFAQPRGEQEPREEVTATCSCGSGIPVQTLTVKGQAVTLIALPAIFQMFWEAKKEPTPTVLGELMDMVRIYNGYELQNEAELTDAVRAAYQVYCEKQGGQHG